VTEDSSSPERDDAEEFSTGEGGPAERDRPQEGQGFPQAGVENEALGEADVSRETSADAEPPELEDSPESPDELPSSFLRVRDLSEVAPSLADPYGDEPTPLAQAAEHMLLARQGARLRPFLARPEATRVLVVANQKGGVGKTTSTVNVAAALAQLGQRVLVIDLDPQGNASTALAVEHHRGTPSTYDLLVDGQQLADVVTACPDVERLDVVPATIDLAGAEIELVSVVAREQRLHKALKTDPRISTEPVEAAGEDRYDYVFIDCPPSLGLLTINALVAGQELMIPIQAEYYALEGLGQLLATVDMVRAHLNPELAISAILITMYDARTRLAAGVADEVRAHFGGQVLKTYIPRSVRVSEAPSYSQTVMTYDPGSPGAMSYLDAAKELAGGLRPQEGRI
jgi:chromosome partitioning protein